ncbi:hypothetical protein CC86DRAFT_206811 [Ophiobolus disseminans]|uniref:Asl1-like glycosyl hydrolase catalytic domain-containing protein n=1 Tax=Ophiobolus disseminans TaxID=1469910 RepID=A0A6A7A4I7_9PLEO|nr:hypothetical protein CC86DRAFT_206811 [Ophiobolus disseminans]
MTQNELHPRHSWRISKQALYTILLASSALAQTSKRGLASINTHISDIRLLSTSPSPLSWYYNWSPYANTNQIPADRLQFVPMIHGIDATQSSQTEQVIRGLPQSSTHLLSFNEPDGTTGSGGSSIKPEDAAKAYIEYVVPFRTGKSGGRNWKISHPVTTGSPNGLNWLRKFNESCYKIDKTNGCPTDFIAAHWYGAYVGLTAWLGTLNEFYNTNSSSSSDLKIWVTEMAVPQQSADATTQMMNQTLPYLDKLEYVEKYAWFGAFRTNDANAWTGNGVALFANDGGLTKAGATYLGSGFTEGQKGEGAESAAMEMRVSLGMVLLVSACIIVVGAL